MLIQAEQLRTFVADIFGAVGASTDDSARVAAHLVEANLKGHDSHGVGMVPAYVRNIGVGLLDPHAHVREVHRRQQWRTRFAKARLACLVDRQPLFQLSDLSS